MQVSLRSLLTLAALSTLLLATPSKSFARKPEASVRKSTRAVLEALLRGDRKAAKAMLLTHKEMAGISTRVPPKARYRKMVERWLDKLFKELREAKQRQNKIRIGKPHILDVKLLSRSQKLLRPAVFAMVSPTLIVKGKKRSVWPFYWIADGGRWKLSIKK